MLTNTELNEVSMTRCGRLAIQLTLFIARFLSLPNHIKALLPIWILHTFVFEDYEFTPYLNVLSPEPACGKSTVADLLSTLCNRATSPMCGTAAVLRRRMDAEKPTLLIDEWDTMHSNLRKDCYNVLNTGFRSDGTYSFVSGSQTIELSTFCPKAIIGRSVVKLPDATQSRCISFVVHKALPDEKLEKFRQASRVKAALLKEECERWAEDYRTRPVRVSPSIPASFSARQQDISEVLLAISDDCGGPWPLLVRNALTELFSERQIATPENELLRAVQKFISERTQNYFGTHEFCLWANAQQERPWSLKPLTPAKLAEMLRHYEIYSCQINRIVGGKQKNCRGYFVAHFADAFARYVNASPLEQ